MTHYFWTAGLAGENPSDDRQTTRKASPWRSRLKAYIGYFTYDPVRVVSEQKDSLALTGLDFLYQGI